MLSLHRDRVLFAFLRHPLSTGTAILFGILLTAYGNKEHAVYPKHDFLDHIVTINTLWAKNSTPFGHLELLPFLLNGNIPVGALGIPDFSFSHFLYRILPIDLAVSLSELLGRTCLFFSIYFLLTQLLGMNLKSKWSGVFSGLAIAFMPFWPSTTWTLAGLSLGLLALLKLVESRRPTGLWIGLLFFAPQLTYFAWGGFLLPLLGSILFLITCVVQRKNSRNLLLGLCANFLGTFLSSLGLIRVLFKSSFTSHREDWKLSQFIVPEQFKTFSLEFVEAFFRGSLSFGTFFHVYGGRSYIISFTLLLLFFFFFSLVYIVTNHIGDLIEFRRVVPSSNAIVKAFSLLCVLLILQGIVSLVYAVESSGLTNLSQLFSIPFQVSRVIALSPIVWSLILGITIYLVLCCIDSRFSKALIILCLLFVCILGVVANPSISIGARNLFSTASNPNYSSIDNYFQSKTYTSILEVLQSENIPPVTLSFHLDPMIAAQNGFTTLDGYVYNYPLEYKYEFLKIIQNDVLMTGGSSAYFMNWGSRVYLFDRGAASGDLKFNWCAAQELGAQVLLSGRGLDGMTDLDLLAKVDDVFVYRLVPKC